MRCSFPYNKQNHKSQKQNTYTSFTGIWFSSFCVLSFLTTTKQLHKRTRNTFTLVYSRNQCCSQHYSVQQKQVLHPAIFCTVETRVASSIILYSRNKSCIQHYSVHQKQVLHPALFWIAYTYLAHTSKVLLAQLCLFDLDLKDLTLTLKAGPESSSLYTLYFIFTCGNEVKFHHFLSKD